MRGQARRVLLAGAVLCLSLGATPVTPDAPDAKPVAALPAPGTYALPTIARVRDFDLVDSTGVEARLLGLSGGQFAVVALIYTSCPSACPAALAVLQQVDREISRDEVLRASVRLVTVSFDPGHDTPAKMGALRTRMAPRADWRFLTSRSESEIEPVLAEFGQDAMRLVATRAGGGPDAETTLLGHVLKVYLVDARGDVRNIYSTGFLSKELVLTDLRTLLLERQNAAPVAQF